MHVDGTLFLGHPVMIGGATELILNVVFVLSHTLSEKATLHYHRLARDLATALLHEQTRTEHVISEVGRHPVMYHLHASVSSLASQTKTNTGCGCSDTISSVP